MFTQASNRRHQHSGHIFQGRYKAIMIDGDTYLMELIRHVVLNPIRAKMVDQAGKRPWSSYNAMAGDIQIGKCFLVMIISSCRCSKKPRPMLTIMKPSWQCMRRANRVISRLLSPLTYISQLLERLYDQPKQILRKQMDSCYCIPRF